MTKKFRAIAVISVAASIIALAQPGWTARDWTGSLNLKGGLKFLESDWKPAEDQAAFGVQVDIRRDTWPISLVADFSHAKSGSESVAIPSGGSIMKESRTDEIALGVRKYYERDSAWLPFIGGGFSLLRGELETSGPASNQSDSDTAVGVWAGVGTVFVWNEILNTGIQAKYSTGDVDINGTSLDAGGIQVDALLGVQW